jgi:hypothetical protein
VVIAACVGAVGCADDDSQAETAEAGAVLAAATLPELTPDLAEARAALDKYRDPVVALRDGYLSTVGCLEFPGGGSEGAMQYLPGAMGVHLLNPGLIGPTLDPTRPQVLLYEWADQELRLTAAEWFVPVEVSREAPTIFGRTLDGPMEGHEPLLPAGLHHWDLHIWLWKENPNGLFHPTNSAVTCPEGPYPFEEHPPTMVHVDG